MQTVWSLFKFRNLLLVVVANCVVPVFQGVIFIVYIEKGPHKTHQRLGKRKYIVARVIKHIASVVLCRLQKILVVKASLFKVGDCVLVQLSNTRLPRV